jgi:thiol-disulfide isomerase/thioredoxin
MRRLLTTFALVGLAGCSAADDPKPAPPPPATKADEKKPKLGIGDAAPPLTVAKWVKGDPVPAFAPGKVYVLDFWATWCGPCIKSMPHLNELVAEYKDKGLTAIAVTTADGNNTAEAIDGFVGTRGAKFDIAFARCDTPATDDAYMRAAGQDGIPCSFVVGKDGKIAYIGHPLELDDVLPKVVAGTWRGQADIDEIAKANAELDDLTNKAEKDPAGALAGLDGFAKAYPWKAAQDPFAVRKVLILLLNKKGDEAKAVTDGLMKKYAAKKDAAGYGTLRDVWTSRDLNPGRVSVEVGLAAADAALALAGADDPGTLFRTAEAYFQAGQPAKAVSLAEKAAGVVTSDEEKAFFAKQIRKYKGETDEPKK